MTLSAFIDANVLFSAADPASASRRLLRAAAPVVRLVTCHYAVAEARTNISRKRPDFDRELSAVLKQVNVVPTSAFHLPVRLVSKDIPILCSAASVACDVLVTGDFNDFTHLFRRTIHGVRVVRPKEFAAVVASLHRSP